MVSQPGNFSIYDLTCVIGPDNEQVDFIWQCVCVYPDNAGRMSKRG